VRQLLLAALGAAGSLVVDLPALAQLSNATSTFSGQVAATCSIDLPQSYPLSYISVNNQLFTMEELFFSTNAGVVKLSVDAIAVNSEPPPLSSEITARISVAKADEWLAGDWAIATKSNASAIKTYNVDTVNPVSFTLQFEVKTTGTSSGRYELPPGNYSYTATISCLQ